MRRSIFTLGGIGVLALVLMASGCSPRAASVPKPAGPAPTVVTVTPASNVMWDQTVSIIGTLYPRDEATIAAQVAGQVEKTLVDFGDRVKSNQDLAYIDTASYEALVEQAVGNVARAEATLINARQNFSRIETLRSENISSQSEYDQATSELAAAEAALKAERGTEGVARLNLERSRVRAPFDGAISRRFVSRGDYVQVGSPLFEMVNDAVLKFIFQVPERHASHVRKQLPVSFEVDNYPGKVFTGSVYLISPAINLASRSFNVGALVTNTDFQLKANTFARGVLVMGPGEPTPAVPVEAIVSFAGVTKLFVIDNDHARSRTVRTGRIRDGLQEILEGVAAGENVVVTGNARLSDGAPIQIRPPGPEPGALAKASPVSK